MVRSNVDLNKGCLIIDESTLDKFYSRKIELVTRHWSGKHKRVVSGINLVTMLWTDGERHIPVDCRIYNKIKDGLTKNYHFRSMLQVARQRGFQPEFVLFDSWLGESPAYSFGWLAVADPLGTQSPC